jgi:hypothetical protein
MAKIPKDLADKDMFQGYKEKASFESMFLAAEEEPQSVTKVQKKSAVENLQLAYLTPALQEKIGKMLLDLKMDLYKEGIVDYEIKAKREGRNIILVPSMTKGKGKQ